jgi:hypothetical protein
MVGFELSGHLSIVEILPQPYFGEDGGNFLDSQEII